MKGALVFLSLFSSTGIVTNPVTGVTLTAIPDQKVFQFDAGQTYSTVALAGTYTGGSPGGIDAQALNKANDAVVVDWTSVGASPSAGAWSGTFQIPRDVIQYYVKVRAQTDHAITATLATYFYVGGVVGGYGQSNWLNHLTTASSPPSANAATRYYDPSGGSWTTVPAANGVRNLMNDLVTATSYAWGIVSGGASGQNLVNLLAGAGTGIYEAFASAISASGNNVCFFLFCQGEGDANTTAPIPDTVTYPSEMDTLHTSLAAQVSRSKANAPMLVGSIATVSDGAFVAPDLCWAIVDACHVLAHNTYPNIYYSHSDKDAALLDGVHWTAASYGRSGQRYARTVAVRLGLQSTNAAWFITSVARVDATHVDVTVVHAMGTDFTPTSGITGFETSGDNGKTWAAPSAAVRQSATVIRLTHGSVTTTLDVLVRYQYGKLPDISAPVVDNSSLSVPLNYSSYELLDAAGTSSFPYPTYVGRLDGSSTGATQTASFNFGVSPAAADIFVVVGITSQTGGTFSSLTITPNGGSPISGTIVRDATNAQLVRVLIPSGTAGIDLALVTMNYTSNPFGRCSIATWTVPASRMSSQTPTDNQSAAGTATNKSVNLTTSAGGFIIAVAESDANATCTWSGTEASLAKRCDQFASGAEQTGADASATAALSSANTVTATFGSSGAVTLCAASWR